MINFVKPANMNPDKNIEADLLKSKLLKENPFEVPDGYFDRLENELMQKISEGPSNKRKVIRQLTKPAVTLAAAMLLLALLMYFALNLIHDRNGIQNSNTELFAELEYFDVDNYDLAEQNLSHEEAKAELSRELLIEYLTTEDIRIDDIIK